MCCCVCVAAVPLFFTYHLCHKEVSGVLRVHVHRGLCHKEVSGVLRVHVHRGGNLLRMCSHMRLWKEEISSLSSALSELLTVMYQQKKGEMSMLMNTLLREAFSLSHSAYSPTPRR